MYNFIHHSLDSSEPKWNTIFIGVSAKTRRPLWDEVEIWERVTVTVVGVWLKLTLQKNLDVVLFWYDLTMHIVIIYMYRLNVLP